MSEEPQRKVTIPSIYREHNRLHVSHEKRRLGDSMMAVPTCALDGMAIISPLPYPLFLNRISSALTMILHPPASGIQLLQKLKHEGLRSQSHSHFIPGASPTDVLKLVGGATMPWAYHGTRKVVSWIVYYWGHSGGCWSELSNQRACTRYAPSARGYTLFGLGP